MEWEQSFWAALLARAAAAQTGPGAAEIEGSRSVGGYLIHVSQSGELESSEISVQATDDSKQSDSVLGVPFTFSLGDNPSKAASDVADTLWG